MREQTKRSPPCKESHANFENILEESPDPMASIQNLHIQQRQNVRSGQELNRTTSPAPQTPQIQVSQQDDDLITFTPFGEQQVPQEQGAVGSQEQPKGQRSPRKKKKSEWTLNQRQFDQNKTQEISHISPRERLNMCSMERSQVCRIYNYQ